MSRTARTLASLFIIGLVTWLVLAQMIAPPVVPATAPSTIFSAARAYEKLQVIARAPHPTGSSENALVRQYLFDQLSALGLRVEIQTSTSVYNDTGKWGVSGPRGLETDADTWSIAGATIHNIIARIPGTASTGTIVLAAHYDSAPFGPAASDDGASVAAILETARALRAGPPLRNDVVLLLNDGEEIGLMGSQAFVKNISWMGDVALVLNFEARGSSGATLMYETSADNAWLIHEYAQAARNPLTGSVATAVWRLMPNSSDLTTFLLAGKQGMNFAYCENWSDYHTTHDSLQDLDTGSLQDHGDNMLSLAQHFGGLDLTTRSGEDAVFFSLLRLAVIDYPQGWVLPLMLVALAVFIAVLGWGLRRGRLTLPGLGAGLLAVLLAMAASALAAALAVRGLAQVKGGELIVGNGGTYHVEQYELGLLAIYLALAATTYALFQRRASAADLAAGALFFWLVLTIGSTLVLPGASYLFLWPLLAGLIVLGLLLTDARSLPAFQWVLVPIPVVIGLVLFGTALYLVQRMFGVGIYPVGGAMSVLLMALVFPYLDFRALPRAPVWAISTALAGILLLVVVGFVAGYSSDSPRQNFLFYSMNSDTGKAFWVAGTKPPEDETLSPWLGSAPVAGIMKDFFPRAWQEQVWTNDAPLLNQPGPEMKVLEDKTEAGVRSLRLKLRSDRSDWGAMADITAHGAILEGELYGERYSRDTARNNLFFKVIPLPTEGVDIGVKVAAGTPITVRVGIVNPELPALGNGARWDALPIRTGYGGGHGVDGMALVYKSYILQ